MTTTRLAAHVRLTGTQDGSVLLDEKRGDYWHLNSTGTAILHELLAGGDEQSAAEMLSKRYPVSADQAAHDVRELAEGLRANGFLARP